MNLKYKTFDSLMASVEDDLSEYANAGMIDRSKFIKEARKVNEDLGLKIFKHREGVINVKDYKADLPLDFRYLELALACTMVRGTLAKFQGYQTEDTYCDINLGITGSTCKICNQVSCSCDNTLSNNNGHICVKQKVGYRTFKYETITKLSLTQQSHKFCDEDCVNKNFKSPYFINIKDDEISFNFKEGKVYIAYLADLSDEEGNLLIYDHPLVNDYYEYAIKKKLFENMKFNKEGDHLQDYQIAKGELREAKIQARNFVSTPEYNEIVDTFEANRIRFYNKYAKVFDNPSLGYYDL